MPSDVEPDFSDDLEKTNEAINNALNELAKVKAYTLKVEELRDFKAAQYALRNISPEFAKSEDVPELYRTRVEVEGNEKP
ncbi:hypothetical protein HFTV1-gp64 [Haloferax tailed virus 1]|uniref:Uncharacterized protein n=1 Tax=Haloferax tailed virus 1 TaxID=2507575 RepID=A0A410N6V6_HFTV1|nr:hypothetical protein M1M17_gp64 [Haloferax tailed virus 1]QAS68897.1 hypothetical protein HFTV1-gp64 [Haloferax tailed virus 1]